MGFVRNSLEIEKLMAIGLVPMLTSPNTVGMYFLWPTNFQETPDQPGYVDYNSLMNFQMSMEAAGVISRFPHHSHLYRLFLTKDWVCHMCLNPAFKVPASTKISKSLVIRDSMQAARTAIAALKLIQREKKGPAVKAAWQGRRAAGVVKLGYSWEAVGVKRWENTTGLAEALSELAHQSFQQSESLIVQELVEFACEMRLFFVTPKQGQMNNPVKILYTRFKKINDGYPAEFQHLDRKAPRSICSKEMNLPWRMQSGRQHGLLIDGSSGSAPRALRFRR